MAGLQSIINLRDNVVALNDELSSGQLMKGVIDQNKATIVEMNTRDQLYDHGVNSLGVSIMDYKPYRPLTIQIKEAKGQPTNRVTLRDEGDFQRSFYVDADNLQFEIKAEDWKTPKLVKKYGNSIFGLTPENIVKLMNDSIIPNVLKKMREIIYGRK